ncbi:MAG: DNA ligase [Candidatus Poribacteria bacterium]|nr:DNA ligase [Candidatus Poribacteria bacterium]
MQTHRQIGKPSRMASQRWTLPLLAFLSLLPFSGSLAGDKPDIMLADIYQQGIDLSQYWVSEKLDGVRARWNSQQLISRGGNVFAAPEWFTKDFPAVSLDGELWMGRRRYEETSSVVRKHQPHEGWRNVRFMAFDLPEHGGTFDERVSAMKDLAAQVDSPYLATIKQETFETEETLKQQLQTVLAQGGEGLMLHRKTARYLRGRSQDLLKLKPHTDAEATVIGYRPGKGKFTGLVGSLKVRTDEGIVFYIGTGLSDEERRHPPPLHSQITFRHQGFTKNGIPRFPVFLRIRNEQPE